jgi:glycosyltransferase involved in cell wall biosynthesis
VDILYHFRTRGTGGEGVHIAGIAKALERMGHSVHFSSPTGADPRKSAGGATAATSKKKASPGLAVRIVDACPDFLFEFFEIGYNLSAWKRNRAMLKERHYDLIYERHAFFLFITSFLARKRKVPLIVEVNELVNDARLRKQPLCRGIAAWADRKTFEQACCIVVVSPHLKRRIVETGVPEEKVLVLPNAIDPTDYADVADSAPLREKWQLEGQVVLGFVGYFVHWHNLEWLVEAFIRLCAEFPNLRLMFVGEGELQDTLQAQADAAGVGDKLLFVGAVPHAEVPVYVRAMDVAIIPNSNAYRSPLKLFEYMGQARATLSPRTEPIEMAIEHEKNGLLFDLEDAVESMYGELRKLVASEELRQRLGEQARADCLEKHTWDSNAHATLVHGGVISEATF